MTTSIHIEEREDHLFCVLEYEYNPDSIHHIVDMLIAACLRTGKRLVYVDFTGMTQDAAASLKLLAATIIVDELQRTAHIYGWMPRVAGVGSPPHISTYKPADDYYRHSAVPIAIFTNPDEAWAWLFAEEA